MMDRETELRTIAMQHAVSLALGFSHDSRYVIESAEAYYNWLSGRSKEDPMIHLLRGAN